MLVASTSVGGFNYSRRQPLANAAIAASLVRLASRQIHSTGIGLAARAYAAFCIPQFGLRDRVLPHRQHTRGNLASVRSRRARPRLKHPPRRAGSLLDKSPVDYTLQFVASPSKRIAAPNNV
jgi:hypothetical protein